MTEYADIVFTRHKGRAITVDIAPARTRIPLRVLADRYAYLNMPDRDTIVFADQVRYRVVGLNAADAVLELELVEDWRKPADTPPPPEPSDPVAAYQAMQRRWQETHSNGEPPAVIEVVKAGEQGPA